MKNQCILFSKVFWPTLRKKCRCDWEKLLKIETNCLIIEEVSTILETKCFLNLLQWLNIFFNLKAFNKHLLRRNNDNRSEYYKIWLNKVFFQVIRFVHLVKWKFSTFCCLSGTTIYQKQKKTIGQLDPKSHPLNSELEWNFCAGYLWEFALDPVVVIFFKRCQKNYKCWIKCISKNDWISQHL